MPCSVSKLRVGDYLSRQSYYSVRGSQVTNLRNNSWTLPRHILEDECYSTRPRSDLPVAQRVFELPLTGLCEKLHSVGDKVFEATFTKKDGSKRVMVAYHLGSDTWLGRSNVMELVLDNDGKFIARKRQIDHRTLTSVVFGGVEYKLKKRGRSSPPNPEEDAAPAVHKARASDLQRNDVVARISYCRVVGISGDGVQVQNLNGKQWSIGASIVEDEFNAASAPADEVESLTMTGLCEKLHAAGDKVFCVVFVKKNGEERTMFAHHIGKGKDTWLGRSEVMELVYKNGRLQEERKQVDHRTIQQLIVGGKKYVLKTSSGSRRRSTPPQAPAAAPPAPVAAPPAAASSSSGGTTRRGRSTANKNKRRRGASSSSSSTASKTKRKRGVATASSSTSRRKKQATAAAAPAPRRSRRLAALNSSS